ncbi:GvpL/GvpF family gas vesicle protein [Kribbella sp. NPDC054772]
MTVTDRATYVYAVGRHLDEQLIADLEGVGGGPVRAIVHRDLTVLVSTVRLAEFGESALRRNLENLDWVERTARRHDEIVRRSAASTTALAPFRLVTIYRSDAAVCDRIEELYDDLVVALERIDRRGEWSVKVYDRPVSTPASPTARSDSVGAGVAYLERRRTQIQQQREAAADKAVVADQLFWDLVPVAAATRRLAPQDRRLTGRSAAMITNATFLVDDQRRTEFLDLVDVLRTRYPSLDIEVNGPWPPYSFAALDTP